MHFRHRDVKQSNVVPLKYKKKKKTLLVMFGKCAFWLIGCVTYQTIPAKLLSALIIHCRLFTPVLHVFCDLWIIYMAVIKNTILMESLDGSSSAVTRTLRTSVSIIHHPCAHGCAHAPSTRATNNPDPAYFFFLPFHSIKPQIVKNDQSKPKLNVSNQVLITGV